jgi:hypothetical protein
MEALSAALVGVLMFLTLWFQEGDLNDEKTVPENPSIILDTNCTKLDKNEREILDYLQADYFVRRTLGSSASEEDIQ